MGWMSILEIMRSVIWEICYLISFLRLCRKVGLGYLFSSICKNI